jgi:hypothetical protein
VTLKGRKKKGEEGVRGIARMEKWNGIGEKN